MLQLHFEAYFRAHLIRQLIRHPARGAGTNWLRFETPPKTRLRLAGELQLKDPSVWGWNDAADVAPAPAFRAGDCYQPDPEGTEMRLSNQWIELSKDDFLHRLTKPQVNSFYREQNHPVPITPKLKVLLRRQVQKICIKLTKTTEMRQSYQSIKLSKACTFTLIDDAAGQLIFPDASKSSSKTPSNRVFSTAFTAENIKKATPRFTVCRHRVSELEVRGDAF